MYVAAESYHEREYRGIAPLSATSGREIPAEASSARAEKFCRPIYEVREW